ncbi:unnamed protein product [Clonostachys byssicola]|uniref:Uncharacterized protein n=1 Tax=Clonostachys byssicola TaxID=160290 RepID=A0A9N9UHA8_9HYPO|nr:unnamed protein product [Clonostachys byssicola]
MTTLVFTGVAKASTYAGPARMVNIENLSSMTSQIDRIVCSIGVDIRLVFHPNRERIREAGLLLAFTRNNQGMISGLG